MSPSFVERDRRCKTLYAKDLIAIAANAHQRNDVLTIDVWADVVCPWCYIGEYRLQKALEQFPHAGNVELRIHTFQLDPNATDEVQSTVAHLAAKYGVSLERARSMEEHAAAQAKSDGLPYELDRPYSSTFDMLRLVHLGNEHGVGWQYMWAMQKELFGGNRDVFDDDTLIRLGKELSIPEDEIRDVLETDRYADDVRYDHYAAVQLGARGVPFTVLAGRVGIPGATTVEHYGQVLAQVWEQIHGD